MSSAGRRTWAAGSRGIVGWAVRPLAAGVAALLLASGTVQAEPPSAPLGAPPAGSVEAPFAAPPPAPAPSPGHVAQEPPAAPPAGAPAAGAEGAPPPAAPAPAEAAAPPAAPAPAGEAAPAPAPAAEPPPPAALPPLREADLPATPVPTDEWWSRALGLSRAPICGAPRAPVCDGLRGDVALRLRVRATEDEDDIDLYQHLRLRWRREDAPGWSASMHLRVAEDLDGLDDASTFFVFDGIDDTYDSAVSARLYHLYANYRTECGTFEQVRLGRQPVTAGEVFHLDGAHVTLAPRGRSTPLRVYAYGGLPAHLYEASVEGEWMVGGGVSLQPWCGATLEVFDTYFEDESGVYGQEATNLLALDATQRIGSWLTLRAGYQHLDDAPRQAHGAFDATFARADMTVRGALFLQLERENEQVFDVDPYYAILLDLAAYWDARLSVAKTWGGCWNAEAGVQSRQLFDEDDAGVYNREFVQVHGTLSRGGWPVRGLTLALTGEWWSAESAEDVAALGFEADWRRGAWRLTAGSDYALWRTDLYTAEERYDATGWYLRARYRPRTCWEVDGGARLDVDDFDNTWTLHLTVRYQF